MGKIQVTAGALRKLVGGLNDAGVRDMQKVKLEVTGPGNGDRFWVGFCAATAALVGGQIAWDILFT